MSRRALLWIGFAIAHIVVAVLGFALPAQPMGDVTNVYLPWSTWAIQGQEIVGITQPWVYPQLALVPMVLAQGLAWIAGYQVAWALLVTVCDALAFALLVGRGRSRNRVTAAWFWLAFIVLLGPVGIYRLEGVTVPLVLAGCLWLVGRPLLGAILLAVATWIKVWPAAVLAAAVIAVRRRFSVLAGALLVSAATLAVVVSAAGGANAFGFITDQTGRGLQLEAPVSAYYLWRAVLGIPDSFLYYDRELLTFQVSGPAVGTVIAVMTPLLFVAVLGVAALGAFKAWRGAGFVRLFPPLALGLVLAFIVFNKVGSPQYVAWIIAPLAIGLVLDRRRWRRPAILGLVIALTTLAVYPLTYVALLSAAAVPTALLTFRNALLVVLLGWMIGRLIRLPARTRARVPVAVVPA